MARTKGALSLNTVERLKKNIANLEHKQKQEQLNIQKLKDKYAHEKAIAVQKVAKKYIKELTKILNMINKSMATISKYSEKMSDGIITNQVTLKTPSKKIITKPSNKRGRPPKTTLSAE